MLILSTHLLETINSVSTYRKSLPKVRVHVLTFLSPLTIGRPHDSITRTETKNDRSRSSNNTKLWH